MQGLPPSPPPPPPPILGGPAPEVAAIEQFNQETQARHIQLHTSHLHDAAGTHGCYGRLNSAASHRGVPHNPSSASGNTPSRKPLVLTVSSPSDAAPYVPSRAAVTVTGTAPS